MTFVAPTFVDEHELAFSTLNDTGGSGNSGAISVVAGDLLVIVGGSEDASRTLGTPTGGGLTYTLRQSVLVANYCAVYVWTAVATSTTSVTVSITVGGSAGIKAWGFNVLRFRNASVGASSKTNVASGAPSLGLTTTRENSAIVFINSDWAAQDGASRTYRTTGVGTFTEQTYYRDPDRYATYNGYYANVGAIAAKTVGLTAPTAQKYAIIALEVQGTLNDLGTPATETDTANAITVVQTNPPVTVGRASETDSANVITVLSPRTLAVGLASETDSASDVMPSSADVHTIGQASETDSALTITPVATRVVTVGLASETDVAQAITAVATTTTAIGRADEVDSAQAVTVLAGPITQAIGVASETDTAQAIGVVLAPRLVSVGRADEVDAVLTVTVAATSAIAVNRATETDSAQALTATAGAVNVAVGRAVEVDTAQDVASAGAGTVLINTADELDSAQPIAPTGAIAIAVGQASEVDASLAVTPLPGVAAIAVGVASETDAALTVGPHATSGIIVDVAPETDTAGSIGVASTVAIAIGRAVETDAALAVATAAASVIALDVAEEVSDARPIAVITAGQLVAVGVAVELDGALDVDPAPGPAMIAVEGAEEIDSARTIVVAESHAIIAIGVAEETDEALTTTPRSVSMGTPFNSTGPCSPLGAWEPIWCGELSTLAMAATGDAVQIAADVLWMMSGQRFGLCQVTLRPCREECSRGVGSFDEWWPGVGSSVRSNGGGPRPWWNNGVWYNVCGGCSGSCSCTVIDEAFLPAPTREVLEVRLNGFVMDADRYRVDENRMLVRTDGQLWPMCQDMAATDDQPNTWSVTITVGEDVPILARRALGQLAAELAKDCAGEDCELPFEMTSLSRQGVNMSFGSPSETDAVMEQLSLRWVSLFLSTYNPNRLQHRAKVYDVDRNPRPWRRVDTI